MKVGVIFSGAFLPWDFGTELGTLPPVFVPFENRFLLEFQVKSLREHCDEIYLTLPEHYELTTWEIKKIEELGVQVLETPASFKLLDAFRLVLIKFYGISDELLLYHGDSLFLKIPKEENFILIGSNQRNYDWGRMGESNDVYAGLIRTTGKIENLLNFLSYAGNNLDHFLMLLSRAEGFKKVFTQDWLDLGHLYTYFDSKKDYTTERAFNEISIEGNSVTKSSNNESKISAEWKWFRNLPVSMRSYSPLLIESDDAKSYTIEYLKFFTLSELSVFGKLNVDVWRNILIKCEHFLGDAEKVKIENQQELNSTAQRFYIDKMQSRLLEYETAGLKEYRPRIEKLMALVTEKLSGLEEKESFMHGDFCFSNVFYDFRHRQIKVIDPRGQDVDMNVSYLGPSSYDFVKLAHSCIGHYDQIICGMYEINGDKIHFHLSDSQKAQKQAFCEVFDHRIDETLRYKLVSLFLSMIPLHADRPSRQKAFFFNAEKLAFE